MKNLFTSVTIGHIEKSNEKQWNGILGGEKERAICRVEYGDRSEKLIGMKAGREKYELYCSLFVLRTIQEIIHTTM